MKAHTIISFLILAGSAGLPLVSDNSNLSTINLMIQGECTIAVLSGAVTVDGRPILWKNRDTYNPDQRFIYYQSYQRDGIETIPFTGDCFRSDTTKIYMGANASGFAIMNSDSYNLHDSLSNGIDDGTLMRLALETCRSLDDFSSLLDSTNATGRRDCWNFGCFDTTGAGAIFECANRQYWRFDVSSSVSPMQGVLIRSNFSFMNDSLRVGLDRFDRAVSLTINRLDSSLIDIPFVLQVLSRDLANGYDDPYPLPYNRSQLSGPPGYIYNIGYTIANRSTMSVTAIRGVAQGEPAFHTTIFAAIGQPVLSPAFPLWVGAESVPFYLSSPSGTPVLNICRQRESRLYDNSRVPYHINSHFLVDNDSDGVFSYLFPLENWGVSQANQQLDNWWNSYPGPSEMDWQQFRISKAIFEGFENESAALVFGDDGQPRNLPGELDFYCYPNPFNDNIHLAFDGIDSRYATRIEIYNLSGQLITEITGTGTESGYVNWQGCDRIGKAVSTGLYLCRLVNGPRNITKKILYLK